MSIQISDSEGFDQKLNCELCSKWLTTLPIYYSTANKNVCGRCYEHLENPEGYTRAQSLEGILQHLSFPCSYKLLGCKAILQVNEIENHEQCCSYKPIHCPKCLDWEGSFEQLDFHITDMHNDILLNPVIIDFEVIKNDTNVFFTHVDGKLFIIVSENLVGSSNYYFAVMFSGSICNVSYCYEFKMYRDDTIDRVSLPRRDVGPYLDLSKYSLESEEMLTINLSCLKPIFNLLDSVKFEITIGEETILNENKELIKSSSSLFSKLQCAVCLECMIPPIKLCVRGHSFCGSCCSKLNQCPLCKSKITVCRNFSLETIISNHIKFCCKNKIFGCTFRGMYDKVSVHQNHCCYTYTSCKSIGIVTCEWNGFLCDAVNHIKEMHLSCDESNLYVLDARPSINNYLIIDDNEIFKFHIQIGRINRQNYSYCNFGMEHLAVDNESKYRYEVIFTNSKYKTLKISYQELCPKYNVVHKELVYVPNAIFINLVSDNKLKFTVNVIKLLA